ncbi:MAG: hypothetical protein U1E16_04700 [Hyphomicrobiales bacterium]
MVESVKAASEVYVPVPGEVVGVNKDPRAIPRWSTARRKARPGS